MFLLPLLLTNFVAGSDTKKKIKGDVCSASNPAGICAEANTCGSPSAPSSIDTLKHSVPKAKLIFLTMNGDAQLVGEAFRAGASAFLLKQSAAFELTDAVEKVLKGDFYVTPRAGKGQANIFLKGLQAREKLLNPLSASGK